MSKPFSQAAENNKGPIHEVLTRYLTTPGDLLEIGAGTGQHAIWLAPRFPGIRWQPCEQPENLPGLEQWLAEHPADNLLPARMLRAEGEWPTEIYRYILTVNTFHILPRVLVERSIARLCERLLPDGHVLIYGPFNYHGGYTSDSNRRFDVSLKMQDLSMGLRDQEWVVEQFSRHGRGLLADHAMPANNRLLVFS